MVLPDLCENCVALQFRHDVAPAAVENWPALHCEHVVLSVLTVNVPGGMLRTGLRSGIGRGYMLLLMIRAAKSTTASGNRIKNGIYTV